MLDWHTARVQVGVLPTIVASALRRTWEKEKWRSPQGITGKATP